MEVSISDQLDLIINAYNMFSSIAQINGYNICNVAADGNCLFAAIAYQLPSIEYIILIYILFEIM